MVVVKTEIRDQIVSTAAQIFSRFGFKKTTMDDIAKGMRKGKSSIYYYFTMFSLRKGICGYYNR